jgi:hypothetical protein
MDEPPKNMPLVEGDESRGPPLFDAPLLTAAILLIVLPLLTLAVLLLTWRFGW